MISRTGLASALVVTTLTMSIPTITAAASPTPSVSGAGAIVAPVVERLVLADAVARSKWLTRGAIDDPVRERAVIDASVAGVAPASTDRVRAVVRDQIEASKTVQRALFAEWRAAPWTAPRVEPDLSVTRSRITDLTTAIVVRLTDRDMRDPSCRADVASATVRAVADRRLTPLQTVSLVQAERSLCAL
ncbi:gamma subclass chorismate mutase AroQ [Williamsia sp. M5A3_1d]